MRAPSTLSTVPMWTPSAPMTSMCSLMSSIDRSLVVNGRAGGRIFRSPGPALKATRAMRSKPARCVLRLFAVHARSQQTPLPWVPDRREDSVTTSPGGRDDCAGQNAQCSTVPQLQRKDNADQGDRDEIG